MYLYNQIQKKACFIYSCLFIIGICSNVNSQSRPILTLKHDDGWNTINTIKFSSDSTKLFTGTVDGIIWDANTGEKLLTLTEIKGFVSAEFTKDNSILITGFSHPMILLWDTKTGTIIKKFVQSEPDDSPIPSGITAIRLTKNEDLIITGGDSGDVILWDRNTGNNQKIADTGSLIQDIQFFPDGQRILIGNLIISLQEKRVLRQLESGGILLPDGNHIYQAQSTGNSAYSLTILDLNTNEYIRTYPSLELTGMISDVSPDSCYLLIAPYARSTGIARDRKASFESRLIRLEDFSVQRTFVNSAGDNSLIDQIEFSPDEKRVALVSGDMIKIYDISDLTAHAKGMDEY